MTTKQLREASDAIAKYQKQVNEELPEIDKQIAELTAKRHRLIAAAKAKCELVTAQIQKLKGGADE